MIPVNLQDSLADELSKIFEHFYLEDPEGERTQLHIYKQHVPVPVAIVPETVSDEELEEGIYDAQARDALFPYIIVRLEGGRIEEIDHEQMVDVSLLVGVIDRSYQNQGYRDILNIFQKIYERFAKNAILADQYECKVPIEWALQDEQSYPYFFGGMGLQFDMVGIRREDPYI